MSVEELFHALFELCDLGLRDAEVRKPGVVTGVAYDHRTNTVLIMGGPAGEEDQL